MTISQRMSLTMQFAAVFFASGLLMRNCSGTRIHRCNRKKISGLLSDSTVRLTTGKCVAQRGGANTHFAILLRALAPREKCQAGIKLARGCIQFMAGTNQGELLPKNYFALLWYVCHHSALDWWKLHGLTWRWWHFHCSSLILSVHST